MRTAAMLLALAVSACASAAPPHPVLTGFQGVPWGASADAVVASLGRPWQRVPRPAGDTYLEYGAEMLGGLAAERSLLVDPDSGLIQGGYLVRIRRFGASCEAAFDSVAAALLRRHPTLQPRRERHHTGTGAFCESVLAGHADAYVRLDDPANGAMMLAALERGRDFMRVTYASPLAVRRARAGGAAPFPNSAQASR
jgi:hypothetical protein